MGGSNVFTGVCHCEHRGQGVHPRWPPLDSHRCTPSTGCTHPTKGCTPNQGMHSPPGDAPAKPGDGTLPLRHKTDGQQTGGRYAFYWNAYLFGNSFVTYHRKLSHTGHSYHKLVWLAQFGYWMRKYHHNYQHCRMSFDFTRFDTNRSLFPQHEQWQQKFCCKYSHRIFFYKLTEKNLNNCHPSSE